MASYIDGFRNLAYAIFQQAWNDAEGKAYGGENDRRRLSTRNVNRLHARQWLMGASKEDRDDQEFWNNFIQDDHFIEQTRLEARRRWAFDRELPRKSSKKELDIVIPSNLPQIECSLKKFCEKYDIVYSRVYSVKRAFGITDEQAIYYVLHSKEGK